MNEKQGAYAKHPLPVRYVERFPNHALGDYGTSMQPSTLVATELKAVVHSDRSGWTGERIVQLPNAVDPLETERHDPSNPRESSSDDNPRLVAVRCDLSYPHRLLLLGRSKKTLRVLGDDTGTVLRLERRRLHAKANDLVASVRCKPGAEPVAIGLVEGLAHTSHHIADLGLLGAATRRRGVIGPAAIVRVPATDHTDSHRDRECQQ